MADERRLNDERRMYNKDILSQLQEQVTNVHDRVYDGLGKEIREEVAKELGGVRKLVMGLLISIIISLFGIVATNVMLSNSRSMENDRNYRAIVDIGSKIENHIITTVKP